MSEKKKKEENLDEKVEMTEDTKEKNNKSNLDQNEIIELNKKLEDLEDKYTRKVAEFENYKKRTEKEKLKTFDRAKIELIEKLLPVIDSIESAKEISKDAEYIDGLNQIYKQIQMFLEKNNVTEIKTVGEFFDPEVHDAISILESDQDEGIILEEFRKGYKLGDNVIRHSMVIVSK